MSRGRRVGLSLLVVALLAVGWFALRVVGGRGADVPKDLAIQPVGAYRIGVATTPSPPRVGENHLTLVLQDAAGQPLRNAPPQVVVFMPAMGTMPYMESRGRVKELAPGVYRADYGLSMGGEWDVNLRLRAAGLPDAEAAYRLSTNLEGATFASGTAALGAPAAGGADATLGAGAAAEASAAAALPGAITLDVARRQALGVRTERVVPRDLMLRVRSSGRVAYDESRRVDVSLQYGGWVRGISADFVGRPVLKGDVLFNAYSPELISAQQEYVQALGAVPSDSMHAGMSMARGDLASAARLRLLRWGVPGSTVEELKTTRRSREVLAVTAPTGGVIAEKSVVDGSPFTAGQVLFSIAPTDPAWVLASVFPSDLARLREGVRVRIVDPYDRGDAREGRVAFIYSSVNDATRAGQVRVDVPNPDGDLKAGMFVDVEIDVPVGRRLAVPESAVLPTGERMIVFVDQGGGRLEPRAVELGPRSGDWYEVRSGLVEGDVVVTAGNFLIAAESKLRSAEGKW